MSVVYLVSSGCYSDYHIEAAFSTKEKAEEYLHVFGEGYDRDIEEWNLDIEDWPKGRYPYMVRMTLDGTVKETTRTYYRPTLEKFTKAWGGDFISYMWAMDPPHAVKIMNERRIAYKLENNL